MRLRCRGLGGRAPAISRYRSLPISSGDRIRPRTMVPPAVLMRLASASAALARSTRTMRLLPERPAPARGHPGSHIVASVPRRSCTRSRACAIDVERGPPSPNDGNESGSGSTRHVGATDVECPGTMGIGNDERIGAQSRELGRNALVFVLRRLARKAQVVEGYGAERRGRAIGPDLVDQILFERHQRRAGRGAGLAQALSALHRVQPGVISQPIVARKVPLDPLIGRALDQMLDRKQRAIHLVGDLQGVASVDEQHGAIEETRWRCRRSR